MMNEAQRGDYWHEKWKESNAEVENLKCSIASLNAKCNSLESDVERLRHEAGVRNKAMQMAVEHLKRERDFARAEAAHKATANSKQVFGKEGGA